MIKAIIYYVVAFFTIIPGLDWLWDAYNVSKPEKAWALSIATILLIIMMALNYCGYRHQILKDRVKKCAEAKKKLEKVILKKRMSSQ
jgi:hypothetical protein